MHDVERRLVETLSSVAETTRAADRWPEVARRTRPWRSAVRVAAGLAVAAASIVAVALLFPSEPAEVAEPGADVTEAPDIAPAEVQAVPALPRLVLDLPDAEARLAASDDTPWVSEFGPVEPLGQWFYAGGGSAVRLPLLEVAVYANRSDAEVQRGAVGEEGLRQDGDYAEFNGETIDGQWIVVRGLGVHFAELMTVVNELDPAAPAAPDELAERFGMQRLGLPPLDPEGPTRHSEVLYEVDGEEVRLLLMAGSRPSQSLATRVLGWADWSGGVVEVGEVGGDPALVFPHPESHGVVALWEPGMAVVGELFVDVPPERRAEVMAAVVEVDESAWRALRDAIESDQPGVLSDFEVTRMVQDFVESLRLEAEVSLSLPERGRWTEQDVVGELAMQGMCQVAAYWLEAHAQGEVGEQDRLVGIAREMLARSDVAALASTGDMLVVLDSMADAMARGDVARLEAEFNEGRPNTGGPLCVGRAGGGGGR